MLQKHIPMTLEHAVNIANDMLDVFQAFVEIQPIQLSKLIPNGRTKFKTFKFKNNGEITFSSSYGPKVKNDFCLDLIYRVIWNNRHFRISFFEDPDELGYCSMLPDYDPPTYVVCEIVEERTNGDTKYEMFFSFDIEKGTFLELFEILHYNSAGIVREYPVNYWNCPIEQALRDTHIL